MNATILDLIECSILDARDPVPLQVRCYDDELTAPKAPAWEPAAWRYLRERRTTSPLQLSLAVGCSLSAAQVWLDAQLHAGLLRVPRQSNGSSMYTVVGAKK